MAEELRRDVNGPDDSTLARADRYLEALVSGRDPGPVDRRLARALVARYSGLRDETLKHQLVGALTDTDVVPWRTLWLLWQVADVRRELVVVSVAERVETLRRVGSAGRRDALPRWLPEMSRELRRALQSPGDILIPWCQETFARLEEFELISGCDPTLPVGANVLWTLIRRGSWAWWDSQEVPALRIWAEGRHPSILLAVIERSLLSLGRDGRPVEQVEIDDDAVGLREWIEGKIQDPARNPGDWEAISSRATHIFERILFQREIEQILALFGRDADQRRSDFWAEHAWQFRGARFYGAVDGPVCLFLLGDRLIVEFGKTGNACYVYRGAGALRGTSSLSAAIPKKHRCADFKKTWGLKLLERQFTFEKAFPHIHGWEQRFVSGLGLKPAPRAAGGRRRGVA